MIRINLFGEKKDNSALYVMQIMAFVFTLILALAGCYLFDDALATERGLLEDEKMLLEVQVKKLRRKTKHVNELEKKRKLLTEKLRTIAKLKSKKQGPVRVLEDMTKRIPERAWLVSISQNSDVLEFRGIALDNQTISRFMQKLKKSEYFKKIELIYSREYMRQGVNLQQFSLSARLVNLLKLSSEAKNKNKGEAEPADVREKREPA